MKKFAFYVAIALLMPYLTVLLVHHSIGSSLATVVGFSAALLCLALSLALSQLAGLAAGILRLVRKLVGGQQDLEAPPSLAEKMLFLAAPVGTALVVYTGAGAILFFWANSVSFLLAMVGLGAVYGGLMAYGFSTNLMDPLDA